MTDQAWCDQGHGMQTVVETDTTDSGDRMIITEVYFITHLACGHSRTAVTGEHPSPLQQESALPRAYDLPDPSERGW